MTAPITPDERAAMRETVATLDAAWEADDPTRPLVTEHATLALLAHVASAVPRLLDALDTAEAEVARLREEATPVRPDRETLIEAMSAALHVTTDRIPGLNPGPALSADTTSVEVAADAVLALWG